MDGKQAVMALCDMEEEYAQLMTEFLKRHRDLPWEIHTYTDVAQLVEKEKRKKLQMLVIAESTYTEAVKSLQPDCIVILNESGIVRWDKVHHINKYQQADHVLKELLEIYMDIAEQQLPPLQKTFGTKFIGMYSPVRRCL